MRPNCCLLLSAAGLMLSWGGAASATCPALPYTIANGQVSDATHLMADLNALAACPNSGSAGATNALQYNAGSGSFGAIGPLTDGQLVIGSTGNTPQAATITAGAGISITNAPGSVTIAAAGTANSIEREFGPYAPPAASTFTFIDTPASITPTVTDVANVGLVYSAPVTSNTGAFPGAYRAVPATVPWTLTLRAKYATLPGSYPEFGIWIKDSGGKMLGEVWEGEIVVKRNDSNVAFNSNVYATGIADAPSWLRVSYDGTNIVFSESWDGQNWLLTYSEASTAFLNGTLQLVGIGGLTGINNSSLWLPGSTTGAVITYWDATDDPASGRLEH